MKRIWSLGVRKLDRYGCNVGYWHDNAERAQTSHQAFIEEAPVRAELDEWHAARTDIINGGTTPEYGRAATSGRWRGVFWTRIFTHLPAFRPQPGVRGQMAGGDKNSARQHPPLAPHLVGTYIEDTGKAEGAARRQGQGGPLEMSNRIEINAWDVRGSVKIPAYAIYDGESSRAECIMRAIARKNGAKRWGGCTDCRSPDGKSYIVQMLMTRANGEVIGEVTFRVDNA